MVSVHEFGSKWSSISVKISSSLELILRAQTLAQKSHESADKATALLQEVMEVVAAHVAGEERAQVETRQTTLPTGIDISMADAPATTTYSLPPNFRHALQSLDPARTLLEQLDSIAEGANRAANAERQKLKELKLVEEEENRKKAEAERQRLVLEARKAAAGEVQRKRKASEEERGGEALLNRKSQDRNLNSSDTQSSHPTVMNSPAADSASTLPTVIVPSRTTSLPIPVQPAPHAEENSRDETPLGVRSKINLPTTGNLSLGMGPPSALNDVASTFNAQSPLSHSSSVPSQKPAICSESKQTPNSPLSMGKLFRDTASVGPKIKLEEEETKPIRTNPSVQPLTPVSVSTVSTCMHPQVARTAIVPLAANTVKIIPSSAVPDSIAGGSSQPPRKKLSPASASKSGAIAPTKRPIRDAVQANIPTRTAAAPLPPCSQVVRIVPPAASTGIVPSPTALSSTGGLSQPPKHKLPAKPVFASAPLKSQETGENVSKTRKPPVSRVRPSATTSNAAPVHVPLSQFGHSAPVPSSTSNVLLPRASSPIAGPSRLGRNRDDQYLVSEPRISSLSSPSDLLSPIEMEPQRFTRRRKRVDDGGLPPSKRLNHRTESDIHNIYSSALDLAPESYYSNADVEDADADGSYANVVQQEVYNSSSFSFSFPFSPSAYEYDLEQPYPYSYSYFYSTNDDNHNDDHDVDISANEMFMDEPDGDDQYYHSGLESGPGSEPSLLARMGMGTQGFNSNRNRTPNSKTMQKNAGRHSGYKKSQRNRNRDRNGGQYRG